MHVRAGKVCFGERGEIPSGNLDEFNHLIASHGLAKPKQMTHGFFLTFNNRSTVQVAQ